MAEFTEVVRLISRICRETENCEKCIMSLGDVECLFGYRPDYVAENAEKIEKSIMDWAAANPKLEYPSWNDAWKSLFPNVSNAICPVWFGEECPDNISCNECTKRPMSKEVAEKLGIKPVGSSENAGEENQ